jgi:diketogulonate reductase-like aldo/keto reductase
LKRCLTCGAKIPDRSLQIARAVGEVAQEVGRSASQVALAWLRAQHNSIIPILGARKLSQLQDNLGCLDLVLSPAQLQHLNEVSQIELGVPHDFLSRDTIRDRLYGGTFNTIDNPRQLITQT